MNRTRLLLIGFVALALGAIVSYSVYRTLQTKTGGDAAPGVEVVVAANDIAVGAKVGESDVKTVRYTAADLPANAFHLKTSVVGRGAILPIAKGEFFLPNKLAGENAGAGMPSLIPPGMRAISVRVNEVIGVAGFVVPGTRVDVLLTGNPSGAPEQQTTTVLENVAGDRHRPETGAQHRRGAASDAGHHLAGVSGRCSETYAGHHPGQDSTGAAQPAGHQAAGTGLGKHRVAVQRRSYSRARCRADTAEVDQAHHPGSSDRAAVGLFSRSDQGNKKGRHQVSGTVSNPRKKTCRSAPAGGRNTA